jgi:hypothetical protein
VKEEKESRPGRRPPKNSSSPEHSERLGQHRAGRGSPRFGDDPRWLDDEELLQLVRGLLSVDRAVDLFEGKRRKGRAA